MQDHKDPYKHRPLLPPSVHRYSYYTSHAHEYMAQHQVMVNQTRAKLARQFCRLQRITQYPSSRIGEVLNDGLHGMVTLPLTYGPGTVRPTRIDTN